MSVTVVAGFGHLASTTLASPSLNRMLNYQLRLTSAAGVPVADGTKNIKLTIYTASSGGTQLYTACSADGSATGTPTAVAVTFSNGQGTTIIGSTGVTCASGSAVAIPADLFNADQAWLGVTVEADAEMTPRKRIVATAYSLNADRLDDLETSSTGGANAFVPVTDSSGNLTLSANVTVDTNTLFVDSANNRLGVGTASPGTKLHLVDGAGGTRITLDNTVGGDWVIGSDTGPDQFFIQTGVTRALVINTSDGFVGFGDNSPNAIVEIDQASGTNHPFFISSSNSADGDILTVRNGGNVGIGDASPASLLTVGSGDRFNVNAFGDVTSTFTTLDGSTTANGAGSNSTTLILTSATNFDVGNYVQVAATACVTNPCFAKITAISVNTLTISPALSWSNGDAVTEVHVPEIGGLDLTQPLANRYGRGYFIDGIVTGNGSTRFSDNIIDTTAGTLNFNTTNNRPVTFGSGAVTIGGNLSVTGTISGGGGALFTNGGNSLGAAAVLGTNDANSLSFETNNVTYLTIASGGGFTLPVDTDWTLTGGVNGLSFDGTTFSVDALNNRVGIGTASPQSALHVTGSLARLPNGSVLAGGGPGIAFDSYPNDGLGSNGSNIAIWQGGTIALNLTDTLKEYRVPSNYYYSWSSATNNNSGSDTQFSRAAAGVIQLGTGGTYQALRMGSPTSGTLALAVRAAAGQTANLQEWQNSSGTAISVVDASGNVGIGDTSPAAMLTVGSGDLFQVNSSGNITSPNDVTWTLGGGVNGINFDSDTFSIDATNNRVGIGTAAPASNLHIQKGTSITDVTDINAIAQYESSGNATNIWYNTKTSGAGGTNATFGWATEGTIRHGITYLTALNTLAITPDGGRDVGGSGPPTTGIFIDSSGNVGVGDNTPDALLDVAGSFRFDGDAVFGDAATDNIVFNADVNSHIIPNTDNTYDLGSASQRWRSVHVGPGSVVVHNDATDTNKMVLDFSGTVPRIVATSSASLELSSSNGTVTLGASNNFSVPSGNLNMGGSTTITSARALLNITGYAQSSGTFDFASAVTTSLANSTNAWNVDSNTFVIDGLNNRIGIGAAAPGTALDVVGTTATAAATFRGGSNIESVAQSGQVFIGSDVNARGQLTYAWSSGITYLDNTWNDNNGDIRFRTKTAVSPLTAMTIKGSGNVGIGTTTPNTELQVHGAVDGHGTIQLTSSLSGTTSTDGSFVEHSGATNNLLIANRETADIRFSVGDSTTSEITLASSGNVGIGTTTPIARLHVPGSVPSAALAGATTGAAPASVFVQDRYAYVATFTGASLNIFDVSNPASIPSTIGSISTVGAANSVYVQGRYAYVAVYGSNQLKIFDVSNPTSPTLTGTVATGSLPLSVYVQGRYAYVVNGTGDSLQVIDVADPGNPVVAGSVAVGDNPQYVYVSGRYAYVANFNANTLQVVDVSNPASPSSVSTVATGSGPQSVYVQGRYAYVTNYSAGTLQIFDVSNPASMSSVSSTSVGSGPYHVQVHERYAYIAGYASDTLRIVDVSNPASPSPVGTVTTGSNPQSVYVQGRYAYVVNASSANVQSFDLGGTYLQQLEAGSIEAASLALRDSFSAANGAFAGGLSVSHGLSAGWLGVDNDGYISGNLGIGDPSPDMKLDVEVTGASNGLIINNTDTTGDAVVQFQNAGTAVWTMGFDDDDNDYFKIQNASSLGTTNTGLIIEPNHFVVYGGSGRRAYFGDDGSGGDIEIGSRTSGVVNVAFWNSADSTRMDLHIGNLTLASEGGANRTINLGGTTSNMVMWNTNGIAAPSFTTRSVGTKLVLYPGVTGSTVDYGFGIDGFTLWSSIPDTSATTQFKWYGATTELMRLSGDAVVRMEAVDSGMFRHPTGLFTGAQTSGFQPDANGAAGIWLEDATSESGGFFANGNNASIWSPGDSNGILSVYDEDVLGSGAGPFQAAMRVQNGGTLSVQSLAGGGTTLCYNTATFSGYNTLSNCVSSRKYKENIQPLAIDVDRVLQLQPVSFDWKTMHYDAVYGADGKLEQPAQDLKFSGPRVGFIAEEVAALFPEIAVYRDGEVDGLEYKLVSVYQQAVLRQHHADIARALKLDDAGASYLIYSSGTATNNVRAIDSQALTFRGSAWDAPSGRAVAKDLTLRNAVANVSQGNGNGNAVEARLTLKNGSGADVAYFGEQGDVALSGKIFPSDRGIMQTSKYIYYDGSNGSGGNRMRTNASGWGTGSYDFAEMFPSDDSLEAGELVMVDARSSTKMRRAVGGREDAPAYLLAGIVSTEPGYLAGMNDAGSYPVALEGRVPARVVGPVKIGDPITVSLTDGVGVAATSPTYVVGYALEAKEGEGPGTVTVFVKTGWWNGSGIETAESPVSGASAGGLTVTENVIDFGRRVALAVGAMEGIDGLWSIDGTGKLAAKEITAESMKAKELTVEADDSKSAVGEGVILTGNSTVTVENPAIRHNSRIFVTFYGNVEGSWWVSRRVDGAFDITVSKLAATDLRFEYWVLQVDDKRTPPAPESTPDPGTPPAAEPAAESVPESAPEPTPESISESASEPASETGTEPVQTSSSEPSS